MTEEIENSILEFMKNPYTAKLKWTDETSYTQGDRGNKVPDILSTKLESGFSLTVMFDIKQYPDEVVMTCYKLDMQKRRLKSTTAKEALEEAIETVKNELQRLTNLLN
jgi:hypothetical protein